MLRFLSISVAWASSIALGGSTTLNINSNLPWTEILQDKIKVNFKKECEVINTGILGASLNDIENLFFSKLIKYKPNHIILLTNHNSAHYDSFTKSTKRTNILKSRFAKTHQVSEIQGQHRSLSDWPSQLSFLRFLFPKILLLHFMDEGRPYPMNWLYMIPKSS